MTPERASEVADTIQGWCLDGHFSIEQLEALVVLMKANVAKAAPAEKSPRVWYSYHLHNGTNYVFRSEVALPFGSGEPGQ